MSPTALCFAQQNHCLQAFQYKHLQSAQYGEEITSSPLYKFIDPKLEEKKLCFAFDTQNDVCYWLKENGEYNQDDCQRDKDENGYMITTSSPQLLFGLYLIKADLDLRGYYYSFSR